MAQIVIRTVGNRSLYRSLAESFDSETRHRTASGALRRVIAIDRDERVWRKTTGHWGTVEIEINGRKLPSEEMFMLTPDSVERGDDYVLLYRWKQAIAE